MVFAIFIFIGRIFILLMGSNTHYMSNKKDKIVHEGDYGKTQDTKCQSVAIFLNLKKIVNISTNIINICI